MTVAEIDHWARDPQSERLLLWLELWLDGGQDASGVVVGDAVFSRTRADLVGVRRSRKGSPRVVIRDHKAKRSVVDPLFDNGSLVRALWAWGELTEGRPESLLRCRDVALDDQVVELETVNLMHAETHEFVLRRNLGSKGVERERGRLERIMRSMASVDEETEPARVAASPGALCREHCPFLHRCDAGQEFVEERYGKETLATRLRTHGEAVSVEWLADYLQASAAGGVNSGGT